jgi:hypothetical protein
MVRAFALGIAVLVVLGLALSLGLRLYGGQRLARAQAGFVAQGLSLDLQSYELPPVPREQNAAAWLEAGAAAIVWSVDDEKAIFASTGEPVEAWDDERMRRLQAIVVMNQGALATLHRAERLPASSFDIPYREGDRARLPDLMALRRASTLLLTDGRLALRAHDEGRTIRSLAGLTRLADALSREATLVTQLLGHAVDAHLVALAGEVATAPAPWLFGSASAALSAAAPSHDRLERLRRALAFDSAAISNWMELEGGGPLGPPGETGADRARWFFTVTGLTKLTRASALESATSQAALLEAPVAALLAERPEATSSAIQIHRWMVEPLARSVQRAVLMARLTLARRQLVHAALVIRARGALANQYPRERPSGTGLDELNPLTRLPLSYSIAVDGSAHLEIPGVTSDLRRFAPRCEIDLPAIEGARSPRER